MKRDKILLADDDVRLLKALSIRLNSEGYDVIEAQDAVQAVSFARQCEPDLLVLDINMPAGDGFTIHQRIQAIEELKDIPVIYLTGERSSRTTTGAKATHASALFYKPLETERFLMTIAEILGSTAITKQRALDDLQQAANDWPVAKRQRQVQKSG